jgi:hypothetical protein
MQSMHAQSKKMNKKAQNVGQLFIYMLAIVIVAVVLIFGYRAITQLNQNTEKVSLMQFQKNLNTKIKSTSSQYGTIKNEEIQISNKYKEICFVTNYKITNYGSLPIDFTGYPAVEDSVESNTGKNVFIIDYDNQMEEGFTIGKVVINNHFKCFQISNSVLQLMIEGKGDHVVIS